MKINIFESMIVSSPERERVYVEFYYNAQNPEQETKESDNSVLYDTCQIAELYWAELAEHFRITLFFPDNKTILDFNASELLGNLIYFSANLPLSVNHSIFCNYLADKKNRYKPFKSS